MGATEIDELGPVDYLVVEFPAGKSNFSGEMAAELASLVESGTIRVRDLLIMHKADDGTVEAFEIDDLDEDLAGELLGLEAEVAEILAAEDVVHLAEAMENGSTAGVLVWENSWAAPCLTAGKTIPRRRTGGRRQRGGHPTRDSQQNHPVRTRRSGHVPSVRSDVLVSAGAERLSCGIGRL